MGCFIFHDWVESPDHKVRRCGKCGKWQYRRNNGWDNPWFDTPEPCATCGGTGKVLDPATLEIVDCPKCGRVE